MLIGYWWILFGFICSSTPLIVCDGSWQTNHYLYGHLMNNRQYYRPLMTINYRLLTAVDYRSNYSILTDQKLNLCEAVETYPPGWWSIRTRGSALLGGRHLHIYTQTHIQTHTRVMHTRICKWDARTLINNNQSRVLVRPCCLSFGFTGPEKNRNDPICQLEWQICKLDRGKKIQHSHFNMVESAFNKLRSCCLIIWTERPN